MTKKTVPFDADGIGRLPNDKPVTYRILDKDGKPQYVGSAKRGRVRERLQEHLAGGPDPVQRGAKVQIEQASSIAEAQARETRIIARTKPPQNARGK